MKRTLLIALSLVLMIGLLAGCGEDEVSTTPITSGSNAEKVILSSDDFETTWISKWKCASSEQTVIKKGDTVEFFDYDNKIDIKTSGITTHWYGCYDSTNGIVRLYKNKDFIENGSMWDYEIVTNSESKLILTRLNFGDEIVLEK